MNRVDTAGRGSSKTGIASRFRLVVPGANDAGAESDSDWLAASRWPTASTTAGIGFDRKAISSSSNSTNSRGDMGRPRIWPPPHTAQTLFDWSRSVSTVGSISRDAP